jgi:hypothetical protein
MTHQKHLESSQSGFITFIILCLLVIGVLAANVGYMFWSQTSIKLGDYCRSAIRAVGYYSGYPMCQDFTMSMMSLQQSLQHLFSLDGADSSFQSTTGLSSLTSNWNAPSLQNLLNPDMLIQSFDTLRQGNTPQFAVTQGQTGTALLQTGQWQKGLEYLKNSASVGEYGVLSQLQLGSVYSNGGYGVPQDMDSARYYFEQAIQSLQQLQMDSSSVSQNLLSALPASPQELIKKLQSIRQ